MYVYIYVSSSLLYIPFFYVNLADKIRVRMSGTTAYAYGGSQGQGSGEIIKLLDALSNVEKQLLSTEWRLAVEEYRYHRDFPIGNAIKGWKEYEGDLKKYGGQFNLGITNTHSLQSGKHFVLFSM